MKYFPFHRPNLIQLLLCIFRIFLQMADIGYCVFHIFISFIHPDNTHSRVATLAHYF